MEIPSNTLIHYIRDKKGNPLGALVSLRNSSDTFCVGWSVCRKTDRFTKEMALNIAIGRASYEVSGLSFATPVGGISHEWLKERFRNTMPHQVLNDLPEFVERCKKYYK
jgi:hypothetical protein